MNGTIGGILVSNSHGTQNNLLLTNARHKSPSIMSLCSRHFVMDT